MKEVLKLSKRSIYVSKKTEMPPGTWKDVVGWEGIYMVSSDGRMLSMERLKKIKDGRVMPTRQKLMTPHKARHGYMLISIGRIMKSVHRIVSKAFIPNPENKPHVNHKNGIRHDNRVENLEWCTASENHLHSFRELGRKTPPRPSGANSPYSKPIIATMPNGDIKRFDSLQCAAKELKISAGLICCVLKGKTTHTHKIKFNYATPKRKQC